MDPSKSSTSSAQLPVTKRPRLDYEGSDEGDDYDLEHRHQMSKALEESNSDLPVGASNKLASEERETLIYSTMIRMHQAGMIYKDGQLREQDRTLVSLKGKLALAECRAKLGDWKLTRAEKEVAQLRGEVNSLKSQLLLADGKNAKLEKKLNRSVGGGMETGASSGVTHSTSILTSTNSEGMTKNRENRVADVQDEAPSSSKVKPEVIPGVGRNGSLSQTVLGTELKTGGSLVASTTLPNPKTGLVASRIDKVYRAIQVDVCNGRRLLRPRRDKKQDVQKLSK